jgi:hypothetical protein
VRLNAVQRASVCESASSRLEATRNDRKEQESSCEHADDFGASAFEKGAL